MNAEAIYSALHLFDRWTLTLRALAGTRPPEPPDVPGWLIAAPEIPTVEEDAVRIEAEARAAAIWRALADGEGSGDHD